jgi:thymidylate kinase
MNKRKGFFLTFEGPEASGKSSQILLLEKYLKKHKISFITTREPGGTKIAESLRNLILKLKSDINIEEEILLLMAARSHHMNNVIIPALEKGKIVISDRFADSTFVYQGYVNKYGIQNAKKLHKNI